MVSAPIASAALFVLFKGEREEELHDSSGASDNVTYTMLRGDGSFRRHTGSLEKPYANDHRPDDGGSTNL
jgi:hypothetical protein